MGGSGRDRGPGGVCSERTGTEVEAPTALIGTIRTI